MAKKTGTVKKKVVKVGAQGMAFVHSTFNNVIITLTNEVGEVISWSSAGKMGFRGSKKNTPYAARRVHRSDGDHRRDADAAQRLPRSQPPPRVSGTA